MFTWRTNQTRCPNCGGSGQLLKDYKEKKVDYIGTAADIGLYIFNYTRTKRTGPPPSIHYQDGENSESHIKEYKCNNCGKTWSTKIEPKKK